MARKARAEYAGAVHHVLAMGIAERRSPGMPRISGAFWERSGRCATGLASGCLRMC